MREDVRSSVFYHIYPLGMCCAPKRNDFRCPAGDCLRRLSADIGRIQSLGVNAIYIGPLFESSAHGYDTVDYYHVDRRLGNNDDLKAFVKTCHAQGIDVVLDAVLNHTGREFFAFKDIQQNGPNSPYRDWYKNIRFDRKSEAGDNFDYEGWAGNKCLAKWNLDNRDVRDHLLGAVDFWIRDFDIDGLRLDAADVLAPDFMDELSSFCKKKKPGFWLMGEVVHGDYTHWAHPGRLDSATNYELFKGLWSSFNAKNFFEIAYSLKREFGDDGIYKDIPLYNFVDNHDVNRVASTLSDCSWLFPLYGLLFTVPGIPSIYYGSEYGIRGMRSNYSDDDLRPKFFPFIRKLEDLSPNVRPAVDSGALRNAIVNFARIRSEHKSLQKGSYTQIAVAAEQFAFMRRFEKEAVIVAVNSAASPTSLAEKTQQNLLKTERLFDSQSLWTDILNDGEFRFSELNDVKIPGMWMRIFCQRK